MKALAISILVFCIVIVGATYLNLFVTVQNTVAQIREESSVPVLMENSPYRLTEFTPAHSILGDYFAWGTARIEFGPDDFRDIPIYPKTYHISYKANKGECYLVAKGQELTIYISGEGCLPLRNN